MKIILKIVLFFLFTEVSFAEVEIIRELDGVKLNREFLFIAIALMLLSNCLLGVVYRKFLNRQAVIAVIAEVAASLAAAAIIVLIAEVVDLAAIIASVIIVAAIGAALEVVDRYRKNNFLPYTVFSMIVYMSAIKFFFTLY